MGNQEGGHLERERLWEMERDIRDLKAWKEKTMDTLDRLQKLDASVDTLNKNLTDVQGRPKSWAQNLQLALQLVTLLAAVWAIVAHLNAPAQAQPPPSPSPVEIQRMLNEAAKQAAKEALRQNAQP